MPPSIPSIPFPCDNPHLIGHEAAETELLQAFRNKRLHHAWLITGPRGVGKATLAFRFARFLLAHGNENSDRFALPEEQLAPDLLIASEHPIFKRIASGGHADLISVSRRMNDRTGRLRPEIGVEDIRSIANLLAHTSAEGGWRVVVIDAAEDMSRSSANALLKVLEEPPARSIFLLVSHMPGQVLPTIRSRCRQIALKPLDRSDVLALMRRYCPAMAPEEADRIASLSEGSIGSALSLGERGGLALYQSMVQLLQKLPDLDLLALNQLADQATGTGSDDQFAITRDFFVCLLARLIKTAATQEPCHGSASRSEESSVVSQLATAASLDRWLEVWEKTQRVLAGAESANLDRKQVILDLFLSVQSAVRS